MSECGSKATLIVTRSVDGTTTNIVKERYELTCREPEGHEGDHLDPEHGQSWSPRASTRPTLVRHEDGSSE